MHINVTPSDYRMYVQLAMKVNEYTNDMQERDQKKKFLLRAYPPTVEQLMGHLPQNMDLYLPYLIYYHEPDLCTVVDDESFGEIKEYLNGLFKKYVTIEQGVRESPYVVSDALYDRMTDKNDYACSAAMPALDAYEMDVYSFEMPLTLERVLSTDPAVNLERFLPFYLKMAELPDTIDTMVTSSPDWPLIRKFARDILYENLDFEDEE